MRPIKAAITGVTAFVALALIAPHHASAFCGFYVSGANSSLYANATMVVLMRDGTKTVLSMQNNYQGPPESFALVIPVPVVLQQENVKTLPREIFTRVDTLAAPRLVEYWEADPCDANKNLSDRFAGAGSTGPFPPANEVDDANVHVEAQFTVGEYEVVVLSTDDATALDSYLRRNSYNIPEGAEAVLRPYVAAGTKFFVAKVDPTKVRFENGQAVLSPLRFHYDTPEFSLPVRLGLLNSHGSQDLIVHVLASQRYEAANYANAFIPTNFRVRNAVRDNFGGYYEALFAQTVAANPRTVVTEYSWSAASCDPCPTPPLDDEDIATLGGDVISGAQRFTLTRLHYRYNVDELGEDLVFRAADAAVGGTGVPDRAGNMSQQVRLTSSTNGRTGSTFQGRYAILHPWQGFLMCSDPLRGTWGGPPGSNPRAGASPPVPTPQAAQNVALSGAAPTSIDLGGVLAENIDAPSLRYAASNPLAPLTPEGSGRTCAARFPERTGLGALAIAGMMLASVFARRSLTRRRNASRETESTSSNVN